MDWAVFVLRAIKCMCVSADDRLVLQIAMISFSRDDAIIGTIVYRQSTYENKALKIALMM